MPGGEELYQQLLEKVQALEAQAGPNITVKVPRERKLKKFAGSKDDKAIENWVADAERAIAGQQEAEAVDFLLYHLEGVAREEVRLRPSGQRSNPVAIFKILRDSFCEGLTGTQAQRKFFERRQRDRESITDFCHALMVLLARVERLCPEAVPDRDRLLRDTGESQGYSATPRSQALGTGPPNEDLPGHPGGSEALGWWGGLHWAPLCRGTGGTSREPGRRSRLWRSDWCSSWQLFKNSCRPGGWAEGPFWWATAAAASPGCTYGVAAPTGPATAADLDPTDGSAWQTSKDHWLFQMWQRGGPSRQSGPRLQPALNGEAPRQWAMPWRKTVAPNQTLLITYWGRLWVVPHANPVCQDGWRRSSVCGRHGLYGVLRPRGSVQGGTTAPMWKGKRHWKRPDSSRSQWSRDSVPGIPGAGCGGWGGGDTRVWYTDPKGYSSHCWTQACSTRVAWN